MFQAYLHLIDGYNKKIHADNKSSFIYEKYNTTKLIKVFLQLQSTQNHFSWASNGIIKQLKKKRVTKCTIKHNP